MRQEVDIQLWDIATCSAAHRAQRLVPILKALADEGRLTLMLLLAEQPRTVRELTEATGMRQTLISHHLGALREQELVVATPRGRSNVYSLCCDALVQPLELLATLSTSGGAGAQSGEAYEGSGEATRDSSAL